MKKIVMLCSALVLGVWPEAQASLWEIEAYTNEKEIGVTSKTSLVAITERMNKLNSVSTVDAKRMYRWLYDYWLSDQKKWSNDGKKSTFGNIQGYVNQDYLVETEKELKMDNDGNYILEKNEIGNKDKNYFSQNADGDYILDWTNTFNLMLKKIENLLPEAAANNGDEEIEKKKTQEEIDEEAAVAAAQAIHAENLKTDYGNKVTWDYTFDTKPFQPDGHDGYIVKDDITGDPILNKDGSKRIESELLAQKQANKEEIAKTLLAQEQALETGKQTTVATLKSLRIVDKDGKMSFNTKGQLHINPAADAWINYDVTNAQHEVQLATEEQRIRHELELEQIKVIENMRTAINQMENSLFGETPNINELTPFDLTYLSAVMEDAGVTVDDDFIVGMKRVWGRSANDMSEEAVADRKNSDGKSTVDPNALTNADVATLLLDHFAGTDTEKVNPTVADKYNLRTSENLKDMSSLLKKYRSIMDEEKTETEKKMTFYLNLVARTLQEIGVEENLKSGGGTATVKDIWFHSFRQYMLQAFREAFSLIKEKHKEDREDWLASLMPDTKTAGIITHEDDSENKDIQWASDLTPCDATKPVAAD